MARSVQHSRRRIRRASPHRARRHSRQRAHRSQRRCERGLAAVAAARSDQPYSPESVECPRATCRGRVPFAAILLAPGDGTHSRSVRRKPLLRNRVGSGTRRTIARCDRDVAATHAQPTSSGAGSAASIPMCTMRCSPRHVWLRRPWSWCQGRRSATTTGWSSCSKSRESKGIIAIDGNRIHFAHPLLARGVYTEAAPAQAPIDASPARRNRRRARAARAASGAWPRPAVTTSRCGRSTKRRSPRGARAHPRRPPN